MRRRADTDAPVRRRLLTERRPNEEADVGCLLLDRVAEQVYFQGTRSSNSNSQAGHNDTVISECPRPDTFKSFDSKANIDVQIRI